MTFLVFANAKPNSVPWSKLHGLGHVEYFSLNNPAKTKNDLPYHIFVRLPDEYTDKDRSFPILYLLDGGISFPLFAASYPQLRWMEDIPPMIVVGISYGTHDWRQGNDRSHDFTVPSKEREHWGGAPLFEQFFMQQLMPHLAKRYRIQADKQVLFGQSLGGQFGLYTSMYGKAPFFAVIASNPALHRNLNYFKQPLKTRRNRPLVYISLAEFDSEQYKVPALDWVNYWKQNKTDWNYRVAPLSGHNHLSATHDAIRNGLMWIFNSNGHKKP